MRYTNKYNLPKSFQLALENIRASHVSSGANVNVTSLIDSPKIKILSEKYSEKIEEDISENILPLIGQAVHYVLEKAYENTNENVKVEELLYGNVDMPSSMWEKYHRISVAGVIDLIKPVDENDGRDVVDIYDYKTTSTMAYMFSKDGKREWDNQLNVYAWLLEQNGYSVRKANIIVVMRDWMRQKANTRDYPDAPIKTIPINLWYPEERFRYVQSRAEVHAAASICTGQDSLPECTPKEMWERKPTFAIKKNKLKRAVRVFDTMTEAVNYAAKSKEYWVEERPGSRTRCESWCPVSEFCNQYKEYVNGRS